MSIQLIQQYYNHVDQLIRYGGTRNEMSLRKAFQELLDHYARSKNLLLVPEVGVMGRRGRTVHPDGTLKDALRQDWGYWESKDEKDTLEDEIWAKFTKGYPDFNILFEDTHTAVLIQGGAEVGQGRFQGCEGAGCPADPLRGLPTAGGARVPEGDRAVQRGGGGTCQCASHSDQ